MRSHTALAGDRREAGHAIEDNLTIPGGNRHILKDQPIGLVAVVLHQASEHIRLGFHQDPSPSEALHIAVQGIHINTIIGPT
ncbi:hypothetical protein H6G65_16020 [Microcystis elabens FACHB-917]|nr:hypothetical protein [Microcystis elabens FACHB-917]